MTIHAKDSRVQYLFDNYDVDKDGKLSLKEFLEFYRSRSTEKPEIVWQNISAHDIGNNLRPNNYNDYEDDPDEVRNKCVLPRHYMSFKKEKF